MLEYEKKAMLSREEYEVLADKCINLRLDAQINYYFDTDDFVMNSKGITCRIRAKGGKYKATIKKHSKHNSNCSVEEQLYYKTELDTRVFDALGLCYQGELVTLRACIYRDDFCEIVLDKNMYLDYMDFEMEIEYRKDCEENAIEAIKKAAECLVKANLISSTDEFMLRIKKSKSKSKRFFERKKKDRR